MATWGKQLWEKWVDGGGGGGGTAAAETEWERTGSLLVCRTTHEAAQLQARAQLLAAVQVCLHAIETLLSNKGSIRRAIDPEARNAHAAPPPPLLLLLLPSPWPRCDCVSKHRAGASAPARGRGAPAPACQCTFEALARWRKQEVTSTTPFPMVP
jgi:hypothetical protein